MPPARVEETPRRLEGSRRKFLARITVRSNVRYASNSAARADIANVREGPEADLEATT